MNPLISVLIPTYNCAKYIAQAIESVVAQNYDNLEIIVVDDGSTDETETLFTRHCGLDPQRNDGVEIKYFHQPRAGAIKARNNGLRQATGDFVLFLDADDVLTEKAIATMLLAEADIVLAKRQDFISPDISEEERGKIVLKTEPYGGAVAGCSLIKRAVFDRTGGFDPSLQVTGDAMEWLLRLEKFDFTVKKLDFVAVHRRLHDNNMGRTDKQREHEDYATVLRNRLLKIRK